MLRAEVKSLDAPWRRAGDILEIDLSGEDFFRIIHRKAQDALTRDKVLGAAELLPVGTFG